MAESASFTVDFRVATRKNGASLRLLADGQDLTGEIPVPNTGSVQDYVAVSVPAVELEPGAHILRLEVIVGGFNINWFAFHKEN